MNDLDLCLEVVSRSRQSMRYIWCWISGKRDPKGAMKQYGRLS